MRLSQPWPEGYTINARSPYGPRVHPIKGKRTFHHGVDVALPVGTPLTAPADGVVVKKGNGPSGGVTLILKHEDNRHTVYYHLQKPSHLAKGATVKRGDLIAYSGNTGASTGPHLHWELRKSARWGDTVDPVPYLQEPPVEPTVVEPEPVEPTPRPDPVEPKPKHRIPTPLSPKLQAFFNFRRNMR
jgi:murein DD-endopeptidase MepM/ murein hydrolase activator NlpD